MPTPREMMEASKRAGTDRQSAAERQKAPDNPRYDTPERKPAAESGRAATRTRAEASSSRRSTSSRQGSSDRQGASRQGSSRATSSGSRTGTSRQGSSGGRTSSSRQESSGRTSTSRQDASGSRPSVSRQDSSSRTSASRQDSSGRRPSAQTRRTTSSRQAASSRQSVSTPKSASANSRQRQVETSRASSDTAAEQTRLQGQSPDAQDAAPEVPHRPQSRYAKQVIGKWRSYGVTACAVIMILGGVIGLMFFARPTTSAVEMRNLTAFPEFTMESFLNGSYFTELSLWYADTYPLREPMVAADHAIDGLFGVRTGTGLIGGNVQADDIPTEGSGNSEPAVPVLVEAPDEKVLAADIQENVMSGVYITDGAGYSIYYFSQHAADTYIAAMNKAAENLDGTATVYSILAPANSITLSDEEAAKLGGSSQEQTLGYLSSRFDSRVKAVPLVDTVKEHRDEYLYFHTDHHWTQLGAYYAYVEFCKAKDVEPKSLSDWRHVDLGPFEGTYTDTIESMGYVATDTVEAWVPSSTNEMTYWTSDGDEVEGPVINEAAVDWEPPYKYSAYAAGDQVLEIIHNPKLDDGSACLIVKDSYGCAFVPNVVDQYETVYVIDFRKTDENICDFVREHDIQDVLFVTGMKIGLTDTAAEALLAEVS